MNRWLMGWLMLLLSASAWSQDGMVLLERFVKDTRTGQANFTQTVTAPARDGQPSRIKTSSGRFEFSRPARFRFTYSRPFEQLIVADGQTLWLHDVDLNQVTARKQADVLGSTPAVLFASANDLKSLQADFQLRADGERDGLTWVQATPKSRDGSVQVIRAGLQASPRGVLLSVLEIDDSLGQKSVMRFADMQINLTLPSSTFRFQPPPGADVLRP